MVAILDPSIPSLKTDRPPPPTAGCPHKAEGHVTQTVLRLLLAYTGLPGHFGVDGEESELTLPFWYLFQEELWSTDFMSKME